MDQIPTVVYESATLYCLPATICVALNSLGGPPVAIVVCIGYSDCAVGQRSGRNGGKTAFGIVGVGEDAVVREVAVKVMRN